MSVATVAFTENDLSPSRVAVQEASAVVVAAVRVPVMAVKPFHPNRREYDTVGVAFATTVE